MAIVSLNDESVPVYAKKSFGDIHLKMMGDYLEVTVNTPVASTHDSAITTSSEYRIPKSEIKELLQSLYVD